MLIVAACFAGAALLCVGLMFLTYASVSPRPDGWIPPPAIITMQVAMWTGLLFGALAVASFLFWLLPVLASMAGG